MTWVAVAVAGGAVVGAVVSNNNTNKAVDAQRDAADQANKTQTDQYNQTRADNTPWRDRGNAAGDRLNYLLGLGSPSSSSSDANGSTWGGMRSREIGASSGNANGSPNDPAYGSLMRNFGLSDFQKDPGYEFRLQEGMNGINNSAAAHGGLLSGATLKALDQYNQNFASNEFQNAYNRFNTNKLNQFNMLSGVAGTGQVANSLLAQAGQNMANNVSENIMGAGNARASAYQGQARAWNNALGTGVNALSGYFADKNKPPPQTVSYYYNSDGVPTDSAGNLQFDP